MLDIFGFGRPAPRDKPPESHLGVRPREDTPIPGPPSTENLTSALTPRRSRKRRRYSRRSDTGSIKSSTSGSSNASHASNASQFAEALSSSSSSGPDSVQLQPLPLVEATPPSQNIFQRLGSAFNIRRYCTRLKKAKTPPGQAAAISGIVQCLDYYPNAAKLFTQRLKGDSQLHRKCLEVVLLHWDLVDKHHITHENLSLPGCTSFHPIMTTLINAVDEMSMQQHLVAFFKSRSDDVSTDSAIIRIYSLFKLLPNPSTTIWCHMFTCSAYIICGSFTDSFRSQKKCEQFLTQFHTLIRTAPIDVLRTATHDISRALESVAKHLYPVLVNTMLQTPPWFLDTHIPLFDLIRTLGEKDLWPEVTSPLRWMVKPGVGSALIQIATNVPPQDGDGSCPLERCLALATLQVMCKFETVKQEVIAGDQADEWFTHLFTIMIGNVQWNISEADLEVKGLVGSKKIYPHEDAYDVLRCFPLFKFATHLTTVMEGVCDAGKEECFKLLEPLAWLTRMEDGELNDAMLSAGVFAFFERVARLPLPENVEGLGYLVECEKKGDALICFRNMFTVMSPAQIARYTTVEMMMLILKLRDDPELSSRVTRRASDVYDAFLGDTKEKRTDRRADEDYRRLWVRVRPSETALPITSHPTEAPEPDMPATKPSLLIDDNYLPAQPDTGQE
ncbi:hypothetical protein FRB99_001350 [Tulasnella sp. 403]|nr:hypothetical protein FRB99_001350 [Tulasnella sp. 403]